MATLLAILLNWFMVLTVVLLVQPSHAQNSPQDYVDAHNAARLCVGVPNVTWDDTVAAYAQHYANVRMGDCSLVHSHGPYGGNLAYGYGSEAITGLDAVNMWLEEKHYYDHTTNCCEGGDCLHYTQVVWHNSIRLGCARVQCSTPGWWFVTCNYWGKRPY